MTGHATVKDLLRQTSKEHTTVTAGARTEVNDNNIADPLFVIQSFKESRDPTYEDP